MAGSGPETDVERGLLQRSGISHLAPGVPVPAREQLPSLLLHLLLTFKQTPLFLCCPACLPKPVGTQDPGLVTLLSWELGSSLETSRSLRSCVLTLLGLRPASPNFKPQPQKSQSQFSSSRLATGNQLFSSSQELEEGNRPPTRTHTPPDTSQYPPLAEPGPQPQRPPGPQSRDSPSFPDPPRLNRDGVGGGGLSRRPRRKGREPVPSGSFPV